MYFPILRGKKYEFLALRELLELIRNKKNVIPIIEPVKNYDNFINQCENIKEINFIVIMNPIVGDLIGKYEYIKEKIVKSLCLKGIYCDVAYQILETTTVREVSQFINDNITLNKYLIYQENNEKVLRLINETYREEIINIFDVKIYNNILKNNLIESYDNNRIIILEDGFKKLSRNKDYPKESYFSEWAIRYKSNNLSGYSDYLTKGREYVDSGFGPTTIAIHYTIIKEDNLYVRHYLSTIERYSRKNQKNKFLEAATLYKNDITNNNLYYNTLGSNHILDNLNNRYFTGVPKISQYSMEHHIELISRL